MAKKPVSKQQLEAYDRLLATHPDIERKGKNLFYTSVNGHMFTVFSTEAKLGIRLPKAAMSYDYVTSLKPKPTTKPKKKKK